MAVLIAALATTIGTVEVDKEEGSPLPLIILFSSAYFMAI
jgi:hypothetical protein